MNMDRRTFVASLFAASAERLFTQQGGVATRTVQPQSRQAPSGKPFSRFKDIAREAGLTSVIPYGGTDQKTYIIEAVGSGCAFLDYDNDGWMDIFILGGTRLGGAPDGATNRLYKNNRDGTFSDVTYRAGLRDVGWAYGVCVRINQRRQRGFILYIPWAEQVISQQWQRNLY